jgi:hypothetical protein
MTYVDQISCCGPHCSHASANCYAIYTCILHLVVHTLTEVQILEYADLEGPIARESQWLASVIDMACSAPDVYEKIT